MPNAENAAGSELETHAEAAKSAAEQRRDEADDRQSQPQLPVRRQLAEQRNIPILQRYAIMRHLITTAQYTPQQLLASDQFHPNDLSYGCLGRMMADALQDEVTDFAKTVAKRKYPAEPAKQAGAAAPLPVH